VIEVPDWFHRGEYIRTRSDRKSRSGETNIEPRWANEAFLDKDAIELDPDPASKSGRSVRTIGWSDSAGFVITVITVRDDDGHLWGVNAFKANDVDQRRYTTGVSHDHTER
jgi:hypothetical protein